MRKRRGRVAGSARAASTRRCAAERVMIMAHDMKKADVRRLVLKRRAMVG